MVGVSVRVGVRVGVGEMHGQVGLGVGVRVNVGAGRLPVGVGVLVLQKTRVAARVDVAVKIGIVERVVLLVSLLSTTALVVSAAKLEYRVESVG